MSRPYLCANCSWELQVYKECEDIASDLNPSTFWRCNQETFPTLSKIARRLFATQCSSAQSERVFSSCGLTLSARRSLLSPDTVEAFEVSSIKTKT